MDDLCDASSENADLFLSFPLYWRSIGDESDSHENAVLTETAQHNELRR